MAQEKKQPKPVVLYSPKGAKVTVSEDAAKGYVSRRYSKTQPKPKPAAQVEEVDVDALRAEIRAELEAEQAEAAKATEKK